MVRGPWFACRAEGGCPGAGEACDFIVGNGLSASHGRVIGGLAAHHAEPAGKVVASGGGFFLPGVGGGEVGADAEVAGPPRLVAGNHAVGAAENDPRHLDEAAGFIAAECDRWSRHTGSRVCRAAHQPLDDPVARLRGILRPAIAQATRESVAGEPRRAILAGAAPGAGPVRLLDLTREDFGGGGDPLVGPERALELADGLDQGEACVGLRHGHVFTLGRAAQLDGGQSHHADGDDGEQDHEHQGGHQRESPAGGHSAR